jgi:C4-dicarboxylate-binding protein DctP
MKSKMWNLMYALIVLMLGTMLAVSGEAAQQTELRFAYFAPESGITGRTYTYFAKTLEEESKGTIKVRIYPAATLIADPDALESIQKGNVDISHFAIAYLTPTIKELTPLEVPGAYSGDKYKEVDAAIHPIVERIMAKYGIKYLVPQDQGTTTFASKKKIIKAPSDIKGLKVRASGKWAGEAFKLWGGSAVTIPLGDLPTSLERGTVDAAYCGWVITGPFKLYESAPYVSFTNMQELFGGLIMNPASWNKLDKEQKAALDRTIKKFMDFTNDLSAKEKEKLFTTTITAAKGTVYKLTDAENNAFKEATKTLMEQVKLIAGADGAELIKALQSVK